MTQGVSANAPAETKVAARSKEPAGRRLVLLCSKDLPRNGWSLARITRAHVSADGKVRKVELVTAKDGPAKTYTFHP